jgi:hypothetical protein
VPRAARSASRRWRYDSVSFPLPPHPLIDQLNQAWGVCLQEAERAYLLWKARQVVDQQGSGAVAVGNGHGGQEGEAREALVDFVVHGLKGDLFPDLMELMG